MQQHSSQIRTKTMNHLVPCYLKKYPNDKVSYLIIFRCYFNFRTVCLDMGGYNGKQIFSVFATMLTPLIKPRVSEKNSE